MTIEWKKEVEARKEALLADLFTLLRVPSVREDDKATSDAPVGPGPKAALLQFLEIGERDGFVTKNIENIAGHLEFGEGEETLGIFGHVDVVPAGTGWQTPPFEPEIRDGKIFARGSSDDKGPTMAAYYALRIIKELGLPVSKRVRFIVGTDEESGWSCMERYLAVEDTPDFGFSPDANFPIINGEKGMNNTKLIFEKPTAGTYVLEEFSAGVRPNMVPESAKAVVTAPDSVAAEQMAKAYQAYLESEPVLGEASLDGQVIHFDLQGKSAHGAHPASGINGGTYLAKFLMTYDFASSAADFLTIAGRYLHQDFAGEKLGIAHTDEVMGELSMNPGIFLFTANDPAVENSITLNIRYPKGVTEEGIQATLMTTLADFQFTVAIEEHGHTPHYVSGEDPLVKTLLAVYEEHTGLPGHEQVVGGGTFGRLLERGVAYGAMFPDSVDTMHQANEFITLDDLFNATVIYADAIYRLIQ